MNRLAPILLGAALAASACSELTTPPAARCRAGQHLSASRCCPNGEEWVPARSRCVCVDPSVCGRGEAEAAAEHAAASAPATPPAAPCTGSWTGELKSSIGARGTVSIAFAPMTPGTLKRPLAASCGSLTERWRGRDGCWLKLVRCARNGPLLIARGSPSAGSGCEAPINVTIRCGDDDGGYRRTEQGLRVSGTLKRGTGATPASAPNGAKPAPSPAKKP